MGTNEDRNQHAKMHTVFTTVKRNFMSDSRRTFIRKLLAAFSLPAFVTKIFGATAPPIKPPTPEIMPSMHVLDQTNGCVDFRSEMTQMEWLAKSSGRQVQTFSGSERIAPKGRRMQRYPSDTMMRLKMGWRGDSKRFVE